MNSLTLANSFRPSAGLLVPREQGPQTFPVHPAVETDIQTFSDWKKKASRLQGALAGLSGQQGTCLISKERQRKMDYGAKLRLHTAQGRRRCCRKRLNNAEGSKTPVSPGLCSASRDLSKLGRWRRPWRLPPSVLRIE